MTQRGARAAVWLIHALGSSSRQWDEARSALEQAAYSVVANDLPGFGDAPPRHDISVERIAHEMAATVAASEDPVVLIGHSLGGVVATLIAEVRPRALVGLINVEGNLTLADCTASAAAVRAPDFRTWLMEFKRACEAGTEPARRLARWLQSSDPATFLALSRDLVRLSTDSAIGIRYRDLSLPRLYLRGDTGFPAETAGFIRDHDLRERVILGASHILVWEQPTTFNAAILEFLTEVA